jgi:hypothetical protein
MNQFRCKQVKSTAVLAFKALGARFFTDAVEIPHIFEVLIYDQRGGAPPANQNICE